MKTRLFFIISIILTLSLSLTGEENEKRDILNAMEFPFPELHPWEELNNPFFGINIKNSNWNEADLKRKITELEKLKLTSNDSEKSFQLGNLYKQLKNNEKAIENYYQYLEYTKSINNNYSADKGALQIRGEIYFVLSEIDIQAKRIDNLEKSLFYFTKTLELNPSVLSLWIKIGDCYLSMGKSTEALYCYNKFQPGNKDDLQINIRLQAALFQQEYSKLKEKGNRDEILNQSITEGIDFTSLETVINNSPAEDKELLKLQQYVYQIRLLLLKNQYSLTEDIIDFKNRTSIIKRNLTNEEKNILDEADKLIQKIDVKNIEKTKLDYISAAIKYLQKDYKNAISYLRKIEHESGNIKLIHDEIILNSLYLIEEDDTIRKIIEDIIRTNPHPADYLILADLEFRKNNPDKAIMLCNQSLKINPEYIEAYSGLAVLYAAIENYIAADEMIKKGNYLYHKNDRQNKLLSNQMKVNEAAIALLKNEKERAYILLRSVISVDNNRKALQLYNRYFIKK